MKIEKPWGHEVILHRSSSYLVKLIHAVDNLSIQVHPKKWEVFTVVNVFGENPVIGIQNKPLELEDLTNYDLLIRKLTLHKSIPGNSISIRERTVHFIGAGQDVIEVSNVDDVTFRIYDFDRGRNLDFDEVVSLLNMSATIN